MDLKYLQNYSLHNNLFQLIYQYIVNNDKY